MTSGTATLDGAVGGTRALDALAITGNLALNAAIAGASSLTVSGSSDLGANVTTSVAQTYTGAVTVSADSIVTGSHITMQALALESGGFGHQLSVANTDTASAITSVISGAGGLTKTGSGTLTLSDNNAYTGGTTISGGTLALATSGTIAASSGVTIHNAGTFSIAGDKTLKSLSSASTMASTNLGSYTLTVGDASDTLSTVSTYAGAISGTGGLTKTGAGTLTLSGNNAYAGTTTVSRGTLQVGDGSTSGTLGTGSVVNNATLAFNRSDALTVANEISGSGNLTKTGTGTLTLSGANTYTGDTTANAGTLVLTGTLNNASHVTLNGTSVWDLRTTQTVASLNMASGTSITNGAGTSDLTVTGTSTLANRINTSGTQTYRSAVTLGADVTLTASTVNTPSTLAGSNHALAIVGAANIGGAYTGLSSLSVSGTSTLGANISTTGTQIYTGVVTLSGADRTLTGSMVNTQSTLAGGGHALAIVGAANIGGAYTGLSSLNVSGASTLGANVSTTGSQTYQGAVTLINGDRTLTGSIVIANNADNLWGSVLSLTADTVDISAGNLPLTLGSVTAGAGGSIRAGTVHLNGQMTVRSGTLTLLASADASGNTTNSNKLSPTQNSVYYSADVVTQGTSGKIDLLQGARLVVLAPGNSANGGVGGSVALTHADNSFAGELEILSGAANATWSDHRDNGQSVQGRVQVNGYGVRIGGAGIEADIVSVRANQLSTLGNAVITARMPFNNAMEASATVPGLTLDLTPAAFTLASPFGRTGAEIAVGVGYGASFNAGLVSALPQNGAQGATAVVLKGPAVGNGYTFYSTNAGDQTAIPVYYNGLMPSTPEVSGAISATISVIENARRQGFEEALRTENVATRLRSGVIAEVGPGRSATTGSQGIALPELCDPGVTGDCNGEEK
jgi:autotransporter-associated beta strand protein